MKRLTLIVFMIIAGTTSVLAQNKSIIGKWKLSSFSGQGMNVDLDNPAETKKLIAEQMSKQGTIDSAQLEMSYNMLISMFGSIAFEFTDKGKAYFTKPSPFGGEPVMDTVTYVADLKTGLFVTTQKTPGGEEKKDTGKISFDGDLLVMENSEEGVVLKLKRAN